MGVDGRECSGQHRQIHSHPTQQGQHGIRRVCEPTLVTAHTADTVEAPVAPIFRPLVAIAQANNGLIAGLSAINSIENRLTNKKRLDNRIALDARKPKDLAMARRIRGPSKK